MGGAGLRVRCKKKKHIASFDAEDVFLVFGFDCWVGEGWTGWMVRWSFRLWFSLFVVYSGYDPEARAPMSIWRNNRDLHM